MISSIGAKAAAHRSRSGGATLTGAEDNPGGDAATFGAVRARAPE
jgi:hypothetical protein